MPSIPEKGVTGKRRRKAYAIGMPLLAIGLLIVNMTAVLAPWLGLTLPLLWSLIILGAILTAIGLVVFLKYIRSTGAPSGVPAVIIDLFLQVKPEKTFKTRNYVVMKKGGVYVLLSRMSNAAYFVKLFDQISVQDKVVKLPLIFFRGTQFKDEVAGLPAAKSRGEITIPVDVENLAGKVNEKYVKGRGISYLVPIFNVGDGKDLSERFSRTVILNIIGEMSNEKLQSGP